MTQNTLTWANFFHIYQPPNWNESIVRKVARESYQPVVSILKKNPRVKVTLNITASLTEQLHALGYTQLIRDVTTLAKRDQIELTGSAAFHALLPLLPPREIERQIQLNQKMNRRFFGPVYKPRGFFPPEMAYHRKLIKHTEKQGYRWILADEISRNKKLNSVTQDTRYLISGTRSDIIFRNRYISDYFTFHGNPSRPEEFRKAVEKDGRSHTALVTAMDGENLGHHRKGWNRFWKKLVTDPSVKTLTLSELLKQTPGKTSIRPVPASWSSQARELGRKNPYALWNDPGNPIHKNQWRLINYLLDTVRKNRSHPQYEKARDLMDRRMASDQFWWASAKPWWSLEIIEKKTKELLSVAYLFDREDAVALNLANRILKTAREWQRSRLYKKTANNYLAANEDAGVRFMGGDKVTSIN